MKVLVVDDEIFIAELFTEYLTAYNIEVDHAPTVQDAERMVGNFHYDLVACDISLPDGNGLDVLKKLQGKPGNTYKIVISGNAFEHFKLARTLGAHLVMDKPVDFIYISKLIYGLKDYIDAANKRGTYRFQLIKQSAVQVKVNEKVYLAKLINISYDGCCLQLEGNGELGSTDCLIQSNPLISGEVKGSIRWNKKSGENKLLGIQFNQSQDFNDLNVHEIISANYLDMY